MSGLISMVTPLLLHMAVSDVVVVLLGQELDSALCTALASLIVIPAAYWMYLGDRKKQAAAGAAFRDGEQAADKRTYCRNLHSSENETGKNRFRAVYGVLCLIAGGVLNIIWSSVLNQLQLQNYFSNEAQEALLASGLPVQILGLGLLVPIAEEMVFRGLIYQRMKNFFPVWAAVIFSSALFAVYHGNPIQIIFAFPMALALAAVYEYGGWFGFPVLFHMGANLAAVLPGVI